MLLRSLPMSSRSLTRLPRAQGDGLVDAVTLSAGGGGTRVHNAQVTVVQSHSPARQSAVPEVREVREVWEVREVREVQLLGGDDEAPRREPSPLSSARSSLSEGGVMALARSRDALEAASRRSSSRQPSGSAAQGAPALGLASDGATVVVPDGRHCVRCEEMTLVASAFGGLCYYCHSFPRAETWQQLKARFALFAALRAALSSSPSSGGKPSPSSAFDLPGLELQV